MRAVWLLSLAVMAGLLTGCTPGEPETPETTDPAPTKTSEPETPAEPEAPAALASPAFELKMDANGKPETSPPTMEMPKDGEEVGVIATNLGWIVVKFYPEIAPKHVERFKMLSNSGFYNGTKFHRVIPGFMIQGGDPNSKDDNRMDDGTGGYMVDGAEQNVPAEFNDKIPHLRGVLSAARSNDPDSASSQFFIMDQDNAGLDGQYSSYGRVVMGMDTVNRIVNLPRDGNDNPLEKNPAVILDVQIMKWPLTALEGKVVDGVQTREGGSE